jgi:hypothetical protein
MAISPFDKARIKMGDGAVTEVFELVCGIEEVSVSYAAQTQEQYRRDDCDAPFSVAVRTIKATGSAVDVSGNGLIDKPFVAKIIAALGKSKNYRIEIYKDNGTPAGLLDGTFSGPFLLDANNMTFTEESQATAEITLKSNGAIVWTPAP